VENALIQPLSFKRHRYPARWSATRCGYVFASPWACATSKNC